MKKLLLLACAVLALTACKKDDKGSKGQLDPDAKIALNPAPGAWSASETKTNPEHLTALEIVQRASSIWYWNDAITTSTSIGRAFADHQRDIVNVRLLMFGTDIIDQDGKYEPEFIESYDVILTETHAGNTADNQGMDTIGYIKNATLRSAKAQIKAAFAQEDYTACYEIFNEAFTFNPITGAEWLVLKKAGTN